MRKYLFGFIFATLVLAFAAVWLGGLNQDEGWYLYAANQVAEGRIPYRDFFFTQGPLMPIVYSALTGVWKNFGLLGARVLNLLVGFIGIGFAAALAYRLTRRASAALVAAFLLGVNLYHLYYLAIPKTYALAALFMMLGFYLLSFPQFTFLAALALALAAGTRISLGVILAVVGLALLSKRQLKRTIVFAAGGLIGLAAVYGPYLIDANSLAALLSAQSYHTARGGFDIIWTIGSLSRLVRWYLPVFIVLGLGWKMKEKQAKLLLYSFLAVFIVQMLAPFPYEDYQVPIMALLAVYAAVNFTSTATSNFNLLLILGLTFANAFGSPLLEKWMTNGQDRFWSLKKEKTELQQLREVARRIEALDPNGKELLTQDLYLAIETNRKVPEGFEMGPFSYWGDRLPYRSTHRVAFNDELLRNYLSTTTCPIAALSGYTFAITAPECTMTPIERQLEYWKLLKSNYRLVDKEEAFGQSATPLLILKRK